MLRCAVLAAAFAGACGRIDFDPLLDAGPSGGDGSSGTIAVHTVGETWQPEPLAHGESFAFSVSLVFSDAWTGYAEVKAVPSWRIATIDASYVGVNAPAIMSSLASASLDL